MQNRNMSSWIAAGIFFTFVLCQPLLAEYTDPQQRFSLEPPEGWEVQVPEDELGMVIFTAQDGVTSLIILPREVPQSATLDTLPSQYEQLLREAQPEISLQLLEERSVEIAGQPALQRYYIMERGKGERAAKAMVTFIKVGNLSLTLAATTGEAEFAHVEPVLQACLQTLRFPATKPAIQLEAGLEAIEQAYRTGALTYEEYARKKEELEIQREEVLALEDEIVEDATGTVRAIDLDLGDLFALRKEGLQLAIGEHAQELFSAAEDAFHRAVLQSERDIEEAESSVREAEAVYREAIIVGLREGLLRQTGRELEGRTSSVTPEQYEKAMNLFERVQDARIGKTEFLELIGGVKMLLASGGQTLPDLTVELWSSPDPKSPIKWLSPYPPTKNDLTTVSILVKNVGSASVDKSFITRLYVDGKSAKEWTFSPISKEEGTKQLLMPGRTHIYDYTSKFSKGKHTFRWVVDAKQEIKESDESKKSNELETSAVWLEPSVLPDLIVESISYDGALVVGQQVTWKVTIKNIGKTDTTVPFMTSLQADGIQFADFWAKSLVKNSSTTFKTNQYCSTAGAETIAGIVDVGNVVPETNENNNKKTMQFTTSYVDLQVVEPITVKTQNSAIHKPVTISFTIKNNGPGIAAEAFKVGVYPGKVTKALKKTSWVTEPTMLPVPKDKLPLKAGASINLQHKVALPYPGDYQAWAMADFPDPNFVYKEKDKTNNTKTSKTFSLKETYYIKIAKIQYTDACKDKFYVWLDRSGGYWKGHTVLKLMYKNKVIYEKSYTPKDVSGLGWFVGSDIDPNPGQDWVAKATIVAFAGVGNQLIKSSAPETKVDVYLHRRPELTSTSPTNVKRGGKTLVSLAGKNLIGPNNLAEIEVWFFWPKSEGSKEGWFTTDMGTGVKTIQATSSLIKAEFNIPSDAKLGKRWVSVEHCGTSDRLSFEVNGESAPSTPSKPKPSVPTKPDLFVHSGWTKPEWPSPGESFTFYFDGANIGTASAPASKTRIVLTGDGGTKSVIINASGLKAKEPFIGWWKFPSGLPKGSHYFDIYLDYNNKVDELNEYNNHVYVGKVIW